MAKVNLLPWREERRKQLTQEFARQAILVAILAALVGGYGWYHVQGLIEDQESRNEFLQDEIAKLEEDIRTIRNIEDRREELLARMDIIQDLQQRRPQIVHLFTQLADTLPDGVYLRNINQEGDDLTVEGRAESNSRVSNYMRNLSKSPWLKNPSLNVIEDLEGRDVKTFKMTLVQTTPDDDKEQQDSSGQSG